MNTLRRWLKALRQRLCRHEWRAASWCYLGYADIFMCSKCRKVRRVLIVPDHPNGRCAGWEKLDREVPDGDKAD